MFHLCKMYNGYFIVPTLVAHQMMVKTLWLLLIQLCTSRKFTAPLYLLVVPLKHGLVSTSDGGLCYCHKDHWSRLCYSVLGILWGRFMERFDQSSKKYPHSKNRGGSIGSNYISSSLRGKCNGCKSYPSWDGARQGQIH